MLNVFARAQTQRIPPSHAMVASARHLQAFVASSPSKAGQVWARPQQKTVSVCYTPSRRHRYIYSSLKDRISPRVTAAGKQEVPLAGAQFFELGIRKEISTLLQAVQDAVTTKPTQMKK